MTDRELYKDVFSRVQPSEFKSMESIMAKKDKKFRVSKRLVSVTCCLVVMLLATVSVDAATGGFVGDFFNNLLGGNDAVAVINWDDNGTKRQEEISMKESDVGIYDENNALIRNITHEEAKSIDFTKDNQICTFNGIEYKVLLICGVNNETGECHSQVRLYNQDDFDTAQKQLNYNQVFNDDKLTVYCPYIDLE